MEGAASRRRPVILHLWRVPEWNIQKRIMSERILFVDDDPNLLAACERNFRRQFPLDTAEGGEVALARLAERGPYAVVVADRQMPVMDGIQLLATVKERAPDTVRIMLTGNADLEAAIRVVNEGNIFRFLTKPCPPDILGKAIEDGRAQYRLVIAEKELLSKTLSGSIKLLTDILSMVDARSFGKAEKLRALIAEITQKMKVENGYVTLPPETVMKARAGQVLSKVEEQLVTALPDIAARLLANIPRLDGVAKIVRYQHKRFNGTGFPGDATAGESIPAGARLLKILNDMLQLQAGGMSYLNALTELQRRQGWYDPKLLASVRTALGGTKAEPGVARQTVSMSVKDLAVGMVLYSDVCTRDGLLVLSGGHQLNKMTLEKIQNFDQVSGIKEPIFVEAVA
jgi:response regulator RpfG family c-di-GMP phosphodiesterase